MKRWISASLLLSSLLTVGGRPAYAVDEAIQVHFLKELFQHDTGEWPMLLKSNKSVIDNSFFERCDARIHWALENNQLEDALRFALLADDACQAVNKSGIYRLGLVKALQKLGVDRLADELLQNILLTDPKNPEANFLEAVVELRANNYYEAYSWFKKAYDLDYKRDDCMFHMGNIDFAMKKDDQGEKEMREALKINPDHKGAKEVVMQLDAQHKNEIKGGGGFKDIIVGVKDSAPVLSAETQRTIKAFQEAGEAALKAGDIEKADSDFQRVLTLNPRDTESLDGLGAIYYRKGNLDAAIGYLERSTQFDPKDREGWHFLGNCLERRFDTKKTSPDLAKAITAYQKSVELGPQDPLSQMELRRASDKKAPSAQR